MNRNATAVLHTSQLCHTDVW